MYNVHTYPILSDLKVSSVFLQSFYILSCLSSMELQYPENVALSLDNGMRECRVAGANRMSIIATTTSRKTTKGKAFFLQQSTSMLVFYFLPFSFISVWLSFISLISLKGAKVWDFDLLDFNDFFTMKSLEVEDFRDDIKILNFLQMGEIWAILFLLPHAPSTLVNCYRMRSIR
jgi:hypothetical protein